MSHQRLELLCVPLPASHAGVVKWKMLPISPYFLRLHLVWCTRRSGRNVLIVTFEDVIRPRSVPLETRVEGSTQARGGHGRP
jgi:hypothetical protein